MLPLPKITLTASDYPRLEQLARAAAQQGNIDAIFLMAEINRAEIVRDESKDVEPFVTVGSWVTYWMNWGIPRKTVHLVWPEDRSSDLAAVSVLSSLGAALIGLRAGDQMPYRAGGSLTVVTIHSVERSDRNVTPLIRAKASARDKPFDDDPGPTAA